MKKNQLQNNEELWKQFLTGDKSAFSVLYKNHIADLYNFGLKLCKDQELVKDALQEVFVSLWNKKDSLPVVRNVKSYLMTSLRNCLLRKMSQSQKTKVFDIEDFLQNSSISDITDETEKELLSKELKGKIDQLPQRQKEVLHLRYYQNMNLTEISEIMNMKYQSVSNLLGRAIDKMKNSWSESEQFYHEDNQ